MTDAVTTVDPQGRTVLSFEDGIPGFGTTRRFTLEDLTDEGTFQLLAAVEDPERSLVVTSPWLFFPDYTPDLPREDVRVLALKQPEDALVFCSVIADDHDEMYVNLRAPFVANARSLSARQVVLDDAQLPLRAPVPLGG
ncbi:MAG: flagellar assembly protein FliW [Nitriliruptoraceae bacterium]|nr:flagellar assembly protein FliW [Nitriliruptoraceae bacterium]